MCSKLLKYLNVNLQTVRQQIKLHDISCRDIPRKLNVFRLRSSAANLYNFQLVKGSGWGPDIFSVNIIISRAWNVLINIFSHGALSRYTCDVPLFWAIQVPFVMRWRLLLSILLGFRSINNEVQSTVWYTSKKEAERSSNWLTDFAIDNLCTIFM